MRGTISVRIPNGGDATSMYRGLGPLAEMRRQMGHDHLNITTPSVWDWSTINMADGVFMQRPYKDDDVSVAEMIKAQFKPLWVDYDDDLFNLPTDNPAYSSYNDEHVKHNIAKIINLADLVTVTTPYLKKRFEAGKRPLNKNIHVVPNAFDFNLFPYRQDKPIPRNQVVVWRGSITHTRDVMAYTQAITNVVMDPKFSKWIWRFIGDNLWFLTDYLPKDNVVWSKAIDPIEYMKHLYDICPKIIQVPLHDSGFNRCKSNIAWIEGTFAGAACLAPDWEEWQAPGIFKYKNTEDYQKTLFDMMSGVYDLEKSVDDSWNYIKENLNLTKWAARRIELLKEINVFR